MNVSAPRADSDPLGGGENTIYSRNIRVLGQLRWIISHRVLRLSPHCHRYHTAGFVVLYLRVEQVSLVQRRINKRLRDNDAKQNDRDKVGGKSSTRHGADNDTLFPGAQVCTLRKQRRRKIRPNRGIAGTVHLGHSGRLSLLSSSPSPCDPAVVLPPSVLPLRAVFLQSFIDSALDGCSSPFGPSIKILDSKGP
jgi:hypothetical protein